MFTGFAAYALSAGETRRQMTFREAAAMSATFDNDFEQEPIDATRATSTNSNGCLWGAVGCGILVVLLAVAAVAGIMWVKSKARQFGTDVAASAIKSGLTDMDIPGDQRKRIDARIDEVSQLFKDGVLSLEDVGRVFERLQKSPLLSSGMAMYFEQTYVADSGLSTEEKAEAEITARRFIRGAADGEISRDTTEAVLDEISEKDSDGNRQFPEQLADDELRAFLSAMSEAANEAGIPEDAAEINFADEFDRVIDAALAEAGVVAEAVE